MQNDKIIAVWGNPNSGKTSFSIKLAKELTRRKKNVILIFCDAETPTMSTVIPFVETADQSLGDLLSAVSITQDSILQKCIPVRGDKYLSVMSYLHGENERTYAQYNKERIVDLLILLKHLADHIIIDCSSHIHQDLFSRTALELSDQVLRLITPDLKALSYYDASLPLLGERKYNLSKQLSVLSNIKSEMPKDIVANKFRGVHYELAHLKELEQQFLEARLFEALVEKCSKSYNTTVEEITKTLIGEADTPERKKLFKKRGEAS